ncbi:STAS domain-containing protein [Nonomuraea sp. NPDC050394]|uniref:STAS domain-containing protein n=1 Tax=Nonomuraea sp. NPDC050394 TaxID=3364363 RepID=UPI0037A65525
MSTPLTVTCKHLQQRAVIRVVGDVDVTNAIFLDKVLAQETDAGACLIVGFGAMSFLDSSSLSVLLRARQDAAQHGTMLCLEAQLNRSLNLLAVSGTLLHPHVYLTVHDAIEDAAAA